MPEVNLDTITQRIFKIRWQRVMLNEDLAALYGGVLNKAILQAVKHTLAKFENFAFQLSIAAQDILRSQFATSSSRSQNTSSNHGDRHYVPYVFTEHGALMLASVLNSLCATEISRMIIRAFVWMRQAVHAYKELTEKVTKFKNVVDKHDSTIKTIVQTLQPMICPPDKPLRKIGF